MSCVKIVEGVLLEGAGNEDSGLHHDEFVVDYEIGSDRPVAAERCREILYARGPAIADETCYVLACCAAFCACSTAGVGPVTAETLDTAKAANRLQSASNERSSHEAALSVGALENASVLVR